MMGEILSVRTSGLVMAKSTFGFCTLGTAVLLLCIQLASATNASTDFALYNVDESTINCFGDASLAYLGVNDTGASSLSLPMPYSAKLNDFEIKRGFCSYKHLIRFSNDFSFSTMFSFSYSPEISHIHDGGIAFFLASNCDHGPSGLAPGCPGSSDFLSSSFVIQLRFSSFAMGDISGFVYVNSRRSKFINGISLRPNYTGKVYVWIDYIHARSTIRVSLSSKPKKPCQGEIGGEAIQLSTSSQASSQARALHDSPFTFGSLVWFYGRSVDPSDQNDISLKTSFNVNVRDWSFNTSGSAVDIYNGDEGCAAIASSLEIRRSVPLIRIIIPTVVCVVLVGVLLVGLVLFCRHRSKQRLDNESLIQATKKLEKKKNDLLVQLNLLSFGARKFTYKELQQATDKLKPTEKITARAEIGRGGFGLVFKGTLQGVGTVAVKRINKTERNVEDAKQLVAEVEVIGSVRHVNIVPLHGWCHEKGVMLLVYKFIDNDNLFMHLFPENPSAAAPLAWTNRMKALRGVVSALVFLHEEFESEERGIHRDIKPTNVMLDSEFDAHLGDFGLARLSKRTESGRQTRSIAGTFGYIAPEYSTGATTQTDVYSFGVLILVVATARYLLRQSWLNSSVMS